MYKKDEKCILNSYHKIWREETTKKTQEYRGR